MPRPTLRKLFLFLIAFTSVVLLFINILVTYYGYTTDQLVDNIRKEHYRGAFKSQPRLEVYFKLHEISSTDIKYQT